MVRHAGKTILTLVLTACICGSALVRPVHGFQLFSNANGKNYSWNITAGNVVKWNLAPGTPDMVRQSMQAVTQAWTDATSGALRFKEEAGGIEVIWDANATKIVDPVYLAYTVFNADATQTIQYARIIINAGTYSWQRGGYTGVGPEVDGKREANLDSVMMHELGHALGIDHSDKNPSGIVGSATSSDLPTMNSIIYPGADSLHLDDETAARTLYKAAAPEEQPLLVVASPVAGRAPLDVSFTQAGGDEKTVWNFGDGVTTTGTASTHLFDTPGTYTVSASSNGRTGAITIVVDKKDPKAARKEALEKKKQQRKEAKEKKRLEKLQKVQANKFRYTS